MRCSIRKSRLGVLSFVLAGCLGALVSAAVQAQSGSYTAGGFIGGTDRNDMDFTYGAEFEYRPGGQWSYGAILEHTPEVVGDRDATLLLAAANFRPARHPRLKLTGGAGVEFRDYGSDNVRFRAGVGYDLFIEGQLTLTPRIAFDFGEGSNNTVLGATLNYRF